MYLWVASYPVVIVNTKCDQQVKVTTLSGVSISRDTRFWCLQGRAVPCHFTHWYVAKMQPPMTQLDELLARCQSIGAQEGLICQNAQQLLKVNMSLLTAVVHALMHLTCRSFGAVQCLHAYKFCLSCLSIRCDKPGCVLQMQQVLPSEVAAVTVTAASARKLDHELAGVLENSVTQQHRVQTCQVNLNPA